MIFHHPLPQKLLPTLAILMAPPSIGFISWMKLTGGVLDPFGYILFYLAMFLFLLLLIDIKKFFGIKFYLSWRAYSFPLAALALANVLMYHATDISFFKYSSTGIAIVLIIVVILLLVKTTQAIQQKSLCVEEED
jgi:tellurite resistance protein